VVTDESLARCISDIRQALGDEGRKIVRTVPRRGYIVTAAVVAHEQSDCEIIEAPSERCGVAAKLAPEGKWSDPTPLRDTTSVTVLPFATIGLTENRHCFADGMTEEIITQLARASSPLLTARSLSFRGDDSSIDVPQLIPRLGARYLIEGAVRHSEDRVRISVRLMEVATGGYLWGDLYERDSSNALEVQDEVARAVAQAIRPVIVKADMQRAFCVPSARLWPSDALHRGLWHLGQNNPADNGRARECFNAALMLDSQFAPAHSSLALTYLREMAVFGTRTVEEGTIIAEANAQKAVDMDPEQCDAQAVLAFTELYRREVERAWARVSMALALNRHSPMANRVKGAILLAGGRPAAGRDALRDALRLDPRAHNVVHILGEIAFSHLVEGNFAQLRKVAKQLAIRYSSHPHGQRYVAIALGYLGKAHEAQTEFERWKQTFPGDFARLTEGRPRFMKPHEHERVLDGLRRAGWAG
jgi:TolB-like protein